MSNLPGMIAQKLWDAGVRLRDQDDCGAMQDSRVDHRLQDEIGRLVLDHGSLEITFATDEAQRLGLEPAIKQAAYQEALVFLTDAVDEELWILQCRAGHDAWVDAQIDNLKAGRSAA